MEFENSVSSSRPRPWLLIALGLAVVAVRRELDVADEFGHASGAGV